MDFKVLPVNMPLFFDPDESDVERCIGIVVEWDEEYQEYDTLPIGADGLVCGNYSFMFNHLREGSPRFKDLSERYRKEWGLDFRERCKEIGCPIIPDKADE